MKFIILFILKFSCFQALAQNDSTKKLTFTGYAEMYYSYDFSNPQNHEKPNFQYNHKRHNEINANLILAKANYTDKNQRANLGIMAGNYAQYNLSAEPTFAQFIYEANIGIKISKKKNIWLDAGIMPSHIGFEGAISADCWTLTRSMQAENSPYYETGVKISYTSKNEKLQIAGMYLNGWQHIQKPDYIQKPSFGTQITYKPTNKININYSTFIGTDKPDSLNATRQLHDIYVQYEPTKKFGITAGFDIGRDKINANSYGTWFSPVIIIKHSINDNTRIAFRGEYYNDPNQIIVSTSTVNGFKTFGISSNIDFDVSNKIQGRVEGKMLNSKDKIFGNKNDNFTFTTNLTIKL